MRLCPFLLRLSFLLWRLLQYRLLLLLRLLVGLCGTYLWLLWFVVAVESFLFDKQLPFDLVLELRHVALDSLHLDLSKLFFASRSLLGLFLLAR